MYLDSLLHKTVANAGRVWVICDKFIWNNNNVKHFTLYFSRTSTWIVTKAPIIYFFLSYYCQGNKQSFLMVHFLEGIAQLGHWYIGNSKPPFMSWHRSPFNEVSDWAHSYGHYIDNCWKFPWSFWLWLRYFGWSIFILWMPL